MGGKRARLRSAGTSIGWPRAGRRKTRRSRNRGSPTGPMRWTARIGLEIGKAFSLSIGRDLRHRHAAGLPSVATTEIRAPAWPSISMRLSALKSPTLLRLVA